jgi:hypothetical protein
MSQAVWNQILPVLTWWIGDLVEQCQAADIPVFVKQMGTAWAREHGGDSKGGDWDYWAADLRLRQYPTAANAFSGAA